MRGLLRNMLRNMLRSKKSHLECDFLFVDQRGLGHKSLPVVELATPPPSATLQSGFRVCPRQSKPSKKSLG